MRRCGNESFGGEVPDRVTGLTLSLSDRQIALCTTLPRPNITGHECKDGRPFLLDLNGIGRTFARNGGSYY